MAKSKQCYYINHKHIAALKRSRPLSKGEVKKIKSEALSKVDSIRDEEIVHTSLEVVCCYKAARNFANFYLFFTRVRIFDLLQS